MSLLDHVDNYYEQQVLNELNALAQGQEMEEDFLIDVLCVALNSLPPKYYRHRVDMVFYLSTEERAAMAQRVRDAVRDAMDFVRTHRRDIDGA